MIQFLGMIVTYHGKQFLKVQFGDMIIAINPIDKQSKTVAKVARFGADIALSSVADPDYRGFDTVTYAGKVPFAIDGPGEYEVAGMMIRGFGSATEIEGYSVNTMYLFDIDSMRMCILGAHSESDLPQEVKEAMGDVDIVVVPIGGNGMLNAAQAAAIAKKMGASLIIPVDYGSDQGKDALKLFLKETGADTKAEPKLTIKKKDLAGKQGQVVVLDEE